MRQLLVPVLLSLSASLIAADPAPPAAGKLRLAGILGDHMVVQRGQPLRVWGWAKAGETVAASTPSGAGPWYSFFFLLSQNSM